jgi:uncharacterized protein
MSTTSAPVAESQRIGLLDFLRGIAILGILTVNIYSFGLPTLGYFVPYAWGDIASLDAAAFSLSVFFFQQKMYPLLAFLFGVGIFLLTEKEERTGRSSMGIFFKRMGFLMLIGALHALLLWHGDILVWYSFAGIFAYLMRRMPTRWMLLLALFLAWGVTLFCCAPAIGAMSAFPDKAIPYLESFQQHPASFADAQEFVDRPYWENFSYLASHYMQTPKATALEAHYYANGSWLQIAPFRLLFYLHTLMTAFVGMIPLLTGIMMLGILAGRYGLLVGEATSSRPRWVAFFLGILIGIPLCLAGLWLVWIKHPAAMFASMTVMMMGGPLLAGLYILCLSRLYATPVGSWIGHPIECVGRMAMSNYLGNTLVFVFFFHGWGLGMYGHLDYAVLGFVVLASWAVQITLSVLWLRFFHFGPFEWVWRSATYGRLQPLRRRGHALGD